MKDPLKAKRCPAQIRGRPVLAAITLLFVSIWPSPISAHNCDKRSWTYTAADLAEARRRLSSPAIQTLNARVSCAEAIIGAPGLAGPFPGCAACAPEYAGLLADAAVFMRRASDEAATTEKAQLAYLKKEVATRLKLREFLSEGEQAAIRDKYFKGNLNALADAMERAGMASEYHQMASELSETNRLHLQMYRVWIKAVRSCAVWNFRSVDSTESLKRSLCNSDCIESLNSLYAALQSAELVKPDGKVKASLPPMPIPSECVEAPEPP